MGRDSQAPPRSAVIITTFNLGRLPKDAVESAKAAQESVELVVVDDGSTDPESVAVLRQLEADGVRVVKTRHGGVSAARRAGLAVTSAPFVLPLDGDDILLPGSLAALADGLAADGDLAAVWGNVYREFLDGSRRRVFFGRALDRWKIWLVNDLPSTALYRRECLVAAGTWDAPDATYEDWSLWMALAELGTPARRIDVDVYVWRMRRESRGASLSPDATDAIRSVRSAHPSLRHGRVAAFFHSDASIAARLGLLTVSVLPVRSASRRALFHRVAIITNGDRAYVASALCAVLTLRGRVPWLGTGRWPPWRRP